MQSILNDLRLLGSTYINRRKVAPALCWQSTNLLGCTFWIHAHDKVPWPHSWESPGPTISSTTVNCGTMTLVNIHEHWGQTPIYPLGMW